MVVCLLLMAILEQVRVYEGWKVVRCSLVVVQDQRVSPIPTSIRDTADYRPNQESRGDRIELELGRTLIYVNQ